METIKQFILANTEDMDEIKEITEYGCESGAFGALIYYKDTHAFFDTYYQEIQTIAEEYKESTGLTLDEIV